MTRRCIVPLFALLLLPAAPSLAQDASALRARLERVRAARPASVPEGTLVSIEYHLDISERIAPRFPTQSETWRARAARFLDAAEAGRDPYPAAGGQLLNRGYDATFSAEPQGYAIYIPPDYSPERSYPLVVMLHGGSSNGNLFLGVVLGNNMDWLRYSQFLWDDFTPRWSPDCIVVAPDGVGQPIWRWMGEQDVLEVIDDVTRHYNVDPDRVVLGGLSNGGMGAYSVGSRHAWRFSYVHAMAGAPSWLQYTGGSPTPAERTAMQRYSAFNLFENTVNTEFHYHHGDVDPGPMRPAFVQELTRHVTGTLGLTPNEHWYHHGHDLLYIVHRHGRAYPGFVARRRDRRPAEVRVVTGDYRANRQHWVTVTRIERYPELARVRATAGEGAIRAETDNVLEVSFDLRDAPLGAGSDARIELDGTEIFRGPRAHLGHVVHASRGEDGAWRLGFLPPAEGLEKVPRLSGPMSDAYHDEIVHVYGTQVPEHTEALRRTAQRGATGWPTGVWYLGQRVIPDTEVTPELMRTAHLALYGSPGDNAVLDRIASALPIRAEGGAVAMANGTRFEGNDVGARFVYPNPESPQRYVLVHTGVTVDAVERTRNLPDFLPDYVVYDRRTTASRPRLIAGRNPQLAAGYFDRFWALPAATQAGTDGASRGGRRAARTAIDPAQMRRYAEMVGAPPDFVLPPAVLQQTPPAELPPSEPPPAPARPTRFLAGASDPNGPIARQIARLVPTFFNYRAVIAGGTWHTDGARWQVRPEAACLADLDRHGVPYQPHAEPLGTPVPTPIELTGPVGGVAYRTVRAGQRIVISCEMAARLPLLSSIVRRQGVRAVQILSAHRDHPRQSFHTMGMALDVFGFDTRRGHLSVNDHFVETPAHRTCEAPEPSDWRAAALLRIACDLADSRRFASVLTPNYNDGHRNHFHLDIRPDDERVFVR